MLTESSVNQIAEKLFGVSGMMTRLPGECDSNFHLKTADDREYLLKITRAGEEKTIVDMQNAALQHLQSGAENFLAPVLQPTLTGEWVGEHSAADGVSHLVRLFTFVPGKLFAEAPHSTALLTSLGSQLGHLSKILYRFQHAAARRNLKWDLQQSQWIHKQLQVIANAEDRQCVTEIVEKFTSETYPLLARLRHSVIHGDLNDYNILVADNKVSGFIDFGDLVETATVCELAIATTYAMMDKPDPLQAAAQVVQAYHAVFPLQMAEVNILFDLICMRLCVSVVNSALRKKENPHDAYLVISERPAWDLLKKLRAIDPQQAQQILRAACQFDEIYEKRIKYIGKNVGLSYRAPLHIVRGEGQYLFDQAGKQYLDCVNNISHVGHCHPRVVAAGQKQMALLNTNTRYLHENLVRYAEQLVATMPAPLEVCFLVCSGSEANELALRLAQTHTRRKEILVLDHGYHGNTTTLINVSPYKFNSRGGAGKPDFVHVLPLPDALRDIAVPQLQSVPQNLAAFICESLPSCAGQVILQPHFLQEIYTQVRLAGGVCIADEVQVGLGRVGTHFWGFETQAVVPDIVTMGKPLGNGHPIGAVVTTREIAESFCNGMEYFNSFGGNPVSCAIGSAVLQVVHDENLQAHALQIGNYLKQKLQELQFRHHFIGDVRGSGLFLGVEFVTDKVSFTPAPALATDVVNSMKDRGILLSADGRFQNVIKIKPPMVMTQENCDVLTANFDEVLSDFKNDNYK